MRRVLSLDGRRHRVETSVESGGERLTVRIDGADGAIAVRAPGGWTITRGRRTVEAGVTLERSGDVMVQIEGETYRFSPERGAGGAAGRGQSRAGPARSGVEVRTPMPGKVVRLLRDEGDRVGAGDGVLVFEAMKMQNEIRAPESGVIANMRAVAGTPMEGGEILFAVEPADSP